MKKEKSLPQLNSALNSICQVEIMVKSTMPTHKMNVNIKPIKNAIYHLLSATVKQLDYITNPRMSETVNAAL